MHRVLFKSLILLWTAFPSMAAAEPVIVSLPTQSTIETGALSSLSLKLDQAIVSITIDDDSAPWWKARPAREGQGDSTLSILRQGRTLSMRRGETESPRLPIRMELVVPSDLDLEIAGVGLEVDIQAPIVEPTLEEQPSATAGEAAPAEEEPEVETSGPDLESQLDGAIWHHELHLESSSATLIGLAGVRIEAKLSDVRLRGTSGALELRLEDGTLESEDHFGLIHLTNRGTKVRIENQIGGLLFETTGGEVAVLGGEGPYRGEARGGSVSLLDWSGRAVITGQETQIEARDGRQGSQLEIAGTGLDVDLVRLEGPLEAELEGGRLRGSELTGNSTISARQTARLTLEALAAEEVRIDLAEDASADLRDIDGALEVVLDQARLEVHDVEQLGIKGVDCEMVAEDVAGVRMISLKNSIFDLDLTALERQPAIALRGAVDGRVELAQPCVVRMAGDVGLISENATVTGCELVTLASPKEERMRGQKGYPEGTIVLVTTLEKGGKIEIDGVVVP